MDDPDLFAGGEIGYAVGENLNASTRNRPDLPNFEDFGTSVTMQRYALGRFVAEPVDRFLLARRAVHP